jgi:hypothetical protein
MKQSNIILGIGIIVAVILIAGSFFLKASPLDQQSTDSPTKSLTSISKSAKSMVILPFHTLSKHIIKIK